MKKTQIARAIESLDAEISVLQAARARLVREVAAQQVKATPKPRAVKPKDVAS